MSALSMEAREPDWNGKAPCDRRGSSPSAGPIGSGRCPAASGMGTHDDRFDVGRIFEPSCWRCRRWPANSRSQRGRRLDLADDFTLMTTISAPAGRVNRHRRATNRSPVDAGSRQSSARQFARHLTPKLLSIVCPDRVGGKRDIRVVRDLRL
jgi:hypothetical protein